VWEWRAGLLHLPKTMHMSVASVLFFITPALPNLHVAFQGLNGWHSFQYLAVVLYLNRVRSERGLIDSQYVARVSRSGRKLAWMCLLFTLGAAAAYLLVLGAHVLLGTYGADFAAQHYYFDQFLFLQVDDVITPRWD
jgi:hypothetical protein